MYILGNTLSARVSVYKFKNWQYIQESWSQWNGIENKEQKPVSNIKGPNNKCHVCQTTFLCKIRFDLLIRRFQTKSEEI